MDLTSLTRDLGGLMPLIVAIFLFGSTIKGAMGVGMPLVSVPLLSLLIPSPQAMGLLVAPVLFSNAMQVREAASVKEVLHRMRWLLLSLFAIMFLTVRWTTTISPEELNRWVGGSVLLAALLMAFKPNTRIPPQFEPTIGVFVGAIAGFMGGVSSLTGPVVVAYLLALRMARDEFVGTISVIYLVTALPMYLAMLWYERFGWAELAVSCLAMAPVFLGLALGKRIRKRLDDQTFHRLLLVFLILVAALLVLK